MLLLVDERPEEVTDMKRNVPGIVYASSNDNTVEKHLDLAQLVIERCKAAKVEFGKNIVVLMDSLTRLGRGVQHWRLHRVGGRCPASWTIAGAGNPPKRLFRGGQKN